MFSERLPDHNSKDNQGTLNHDHLAAAMGFGRLGLPGWYGGRILGHVSCRFAFGAQ